MWSMEVLAESRRGILGPTGCRTRATGHDSGCCVGEDFARPAADRAGADDRTGFQIAASGG